MARGLIDGHLRKRAAAAAPVPAAPGPGKQRTVTVGLPHLATVAAKHGRAITVTATTGGFTTQKHTVHLKIKH